MVLGACEMNWIRVLVLFIRGVVRDKVELAAEKATPRRCGFPRLRRRLVMADLVLVHSCLRRLVAKES